MLDHLRGREKRGERQGSFAQQQVGGELDLEEEESERRGGQGGRQAGASTSESDGEDS